MFNIVEKSINWGGRELVLQSGKIARQADGAVVATYGQTSVLATVVFSKEPKADLDFFPLTVNYLDKYYAVGRIPGGFFKREGKPSEKEILVSRLIDRPIRPMFDEKFRNEVQIVVSILSYDNKNTVDYLAPIAASAALAISGAPVAGIIASSKVGMIDGELVLNPTPAEIKTSSLELLVSGTKEGVLMVESEASELTEEQMLDAVKFAHQGSFDVINLIEEFKKAVGKKDYEFTRLETKEQADFALKLKESCENDLVNAFLITEKAKRRDTLVEVENKAKAALKGAGFEEDFIKLNFKPYFKALEKNIVRGNILNKSIRIDGRALDEVRTIATEIDLFPNTHGSVLFTRGETQAIVITTLGTDSDEQIIDDIEGEGRSRFMLHYNFPPFSVGEVGRVGAPGRREIGHGKLAWRAINPMLPPVSKCPYSIRIVAEITESNGSSSMATVCGASMSLMAAGIPLKSPVAGIAMGLIKQGDQFAVLTDILGDEDHLGDMDFKVAGTNKGITALQMDIKITSITYDIMSQALAQAKKGRTHIMDEMAKTISVAKDQVSGNALKIETISISKDKIKDVIGSGGKTIKGLCETYSVKIDISEDGLVKIAGSDEQLLQQALQAVQGIVAVPEIGKIYDGKVAKVIESGAFINFMPNRDGFLHISEITEKRGDDINAFIKQGDIFKVKVVNIDEKGRIKLTVKGF